MQGRRLLLPDKEYFNIGEACRILQVPPHTLRYWESQFKLFRPIRRESGHRRYTRRDMETAIRIKELLHDKKMTAAGARKALAGMRRGGRTTPAGNGGGKLPAPAAKFLREIRDDLRRIVSTLST